MPGSGLAEVQGGDLVDIGELSDDSQSHSDPLLLFKYCANYSCGKSKSKTIQGSSLTTLTQ